MRILTILALFTILFLDDRAVLTRADDTSPSDGVQKRSPAVIRKGPVRIERKESGALLTDDFETSTIDKQRWRVWQMDTEETSLAIEDGRLVLNQANSLASGVENFEKA